MNDLVIMRTRLLLQCFLEKKKAYLPKYPFNITLLYTWQFNRLNIAYSLE